jgi:ankyrin repeat protein
MILEESAGRVVIAHHLGVNELDREGRSPLHYAAAENNRAMATDRIAAGDDPDLHDRSGSTPLHFACQEGALDVARLLLDNDAVVDAIDIHGNTPLFVAVFNSRGRGDLIQLLRERGADPGRRNAHGQTPLGLARLIGNYDVAQFFDDLP